MDELCEMQGVVKSSEGELTAACHALRRAHREMTFETAVLEQRVSRLQEELDLLEGEWALSRPFSSFYQCCFVRNPELD